MGRTDSARATSHTHPVPPEDYGAVPRRSHHITPPSSHITYSARANLSVWGTDHFCILTRPLADISRHGTTPFAEVHQVAHSALLLYLLHRHLSKHPDRYKTRDAFVALLRKYCNAPKGVRQRHGWATLYVECQWRNVEDYGRANKSACPERDELLRMRKEGMEANHDSAIEARLHT